jgi:hypothetical protein
MRVSGAKSSCTGRRPNELRTGDDGAPTTSYQRLVRSYERLEGPGDRIINSQPCIVLHRTFAGAPPNSLGVCALLCRALVSDELTRFRRVAAGHLGKLHLQPHHLSYLSGLRLAGSLVRTRAGKTWSPTKKRRPTCSKPMWARFPSLPPCPALSKSKTGSPSFLTRAFGHASLGSSTMRSRASTRWSTRKGEKGIVDRGKSART